MQNYKELKVWEKSHQLVLEIYRVTAKFPKEEIFGVTSQIRRRQLQFQQILLKDVGKTLNSILLIS